MKNDIIKKYIRKDDIKDNNFISFDLPGCCNHSTISTWNQKFERTVID